jgi:hypothetical protein
MQCRDCKNFDEKTKECDYLYSLYLQAKMPLGKKITGVIVNPLMDASNKCPGWKIKTF